MPISNTHLKSKFFCGYNVIQCEQAIHHSSILLYTGHTKEKSAAGKNGVLGVMCKGSTFANSNAALRPGSQNDKNNNVALKYLMMRAPFVN